MRLRPLSRTSVSLSLGQQVPLKNVEPVRGELGRELTRRANGLMNLNQISLNAVERFDLLVEFGRS